MLLSIIFMNVTAWYCRATAVLTLQENVDAFLLNSDVECAA